MCVEKVGWQKCDLSRRTQAIKSNLKGRDTEVSLCLLDAISFQVYLWSNPTDKGIQKEEIKHLAHYLLKIVLRPTCLHVQLSVLLSHIF